MYLKGGSVWGHEVAKEVKDQFGQQVSGNYSIAQGYKLLCVNREKVQWDKQVWNRWNYPKHSFIVWLAIQNRLTTRERLRKYLLNIDNNCVFCGSQGETS